MAASRPQFIAHVRQGRRKSSEKSSPSKNVRSEDSISSQTWNRVYADLLEERGYIECPAHLGCVAMRVLSRPIIISELRVTCHSAWRQRLSARRQLACAGIGHKSRLAGGGRARLPRPLSPPNRNGPPAKAVAAAGSVATSVVAAELGELAAQARDMDFDAVGLRLVIEPPDVGHSCRRVTRLPGASASRQSNPNSRGCSASQRPPRRASRWNRSSVSGPSARQRGSMPNISSTRRARASSSCRPIAAESASAQPSASRLRPFCRIFDAEHQQPPGRTVGFGQSPRAAAWVSARASASSTWQHSGTAPVDARAQRPAKPSQVPAAVAGRAHCRNPSETLSRRLSAIPQTLHRQQLQAVCASADWFVLAIRRPRAGPPHSGSGGVDAHLLQVALHVARGLAQPLLVFDHRDAHDSLRPPRR